MINTLLKEIVNSALPPLKRSDADPKRLVYHYKQVQQATTPEVAVKVDKEVKVIGSNVSLGYDPKEFWEHNYTYQKERSRSISLDWARWIGEIWKLLRDYFKSIPVSTENLVAFSNDYLIKRKKATSTYAKIKSEFRLYLTWLIKRNLIGPDAMNLMEGFRSVKIVTPQKKLISKEEYNTIRAALVGKPYYYLITLLWTYGMRRGDAVFLKWEHVDWDNKIIRFVPWKTRKKNARPVELPFTDEIEFMLRALKQDPNNHTYVCNKLAKNGLYTAPAHAVGMITFFLKSKGYKDFRGLHIFRHTRASRMLNSNDPVDIYTASEVLGITDLKVLQRYVRVSPENKKKAVNA